MDENALKAKLGRLYKEDNRDNKYSITSLLPKKIEKRNYKYWWSSGCWLDQKETSQCVGYSWVHWLAEGPLTQKNSRIDKKYPMDPEVVYNKAQRIDEWPGEDYDGTSVRAGAKILKEHGFISSYYWAWDIDTLVNSLLTLGPVVVGTTWKYDMFFPNKKGIITATGSDVGGHAYLLDGINLKKGLIRIKNSWGRTWGRKGFAYISIDDMKLLMEDYGEVCLANEIEK